MVIQINSQCIRNRHHWSNCHLCASVCNLNAIALEAQINVDINKCSQCGRCVKSCPFGAVEGKEASYYVRETTLYEDNQYPPTFEKLLLLKAEGLDNVNVVSSTWQQYIEEVNLLLASNDISPFNIIYSAEKIEEISHSRRSLFRFNQLSEFKKTVLNEKINISTSYPNHQLYKIEFESSNCNLCNLCSIYCPEKCIKIESDKIIFDGKNCNGCQLCSDICLTKSISINKIFHTSKVNTYSKLY